MKNKSIIDSLTEIKMELETPRLKIEAITEKAAKLRLNDLSNKLDEIAREIYAIQTSVTNVIPQLTTLAEKIKE